ncbi:MAG: hypothetical protein QM742_09995 [Aquabacterium sp.]
MGRLTSSKVGSDGGRSYVLYDALGRKVGDVDPEGALTEYRYNDAGQLTTTVAYANKVPAATMAMLAADPSQFSVPSNLLDNAFGKWTAQPSHTKITSGENTPTNVTSNKPLLDGDSARWLKQTGADATLNSWLQSSNILLPVDGSRRFEVSAYVGVVNAAATLEVQFFSSTAPSPTAQPNWTTALTGVVTTSASPKAGGSQLADYERLYGFVDAPVGALSARIVVKKGGSSQAESYVYVTHALFAQAASASPTGLNKPLATFDPRPAASNDDRTSWNIYDKAGRLSVVLTAQGDGGTTATEVLGVVEYRYDGAGRQTETIAYSEPSFASAAALKALRRASKEPQYANGLLTVDASNYTIASSATNDRHTYNYYSKDGLLIGQLDAESYYTQYTYNAFGLLASTTRYGRRYEGTMPTDGAPPKVPVNTSDPYIGLDRTTRYYYDGRKQLIGVLDAERYYTAYKYDAQGNRVQEVRYANKALSTTATKAPKPVTSSSLAGGNPYVIISPSEDQDTSYYYAADQRLIRSVQKPGNVITTFSYDAAGNLVSTLAAVGTEDERGTAKRYDSAGRLIAELSATGVKALVGKTLTNDIDNVWNTYGIRHLYDDAGRRVATIEPDGSTTNGNQTAYYYDKAGRLTHSINAQGEITQYTYNVLGDRTEVRQVGMRLADGIVSLLKGGLNTALGNSVKDLLRSDLDSAVRTRYNRSGRAVEITDAEQQLTIQDYNLFGELWYVMSPAVNGRRQNIEYTRDRRGQITTTLDYDEEQLVRSASSTYTAFGQVAISTRGIGPNVGGHSTFYVYDKLGRGTLRFQANSDLYTISAYDSFNRTTSVQQEDGGLTTYRYDAINRTVEITLPEGQSASYKTTQGLDRHGQVVTVTDERGAWTRYTYDADGRLTETVNKDSANAADPLKKESTTYDTAGRVKTQTNELGAVTTFEYDKANRVLKRIQSDAATNQSYTTEYRYDALGRSIWQKSPTGVWTRTSYDLNGRVKSVVVNPSQIPSASQAADVASITLVGNTDVGDDLDLTTTYDYDHAGHLTLQTEGAGSTQPKVTAYGYDGIGRRTSQTIDPNGLNLRTEFVYDRSDNVIAEITLADVPANDRVKRYVYDASNRLSWAVDSEGAATHTEYDAMGNVSRVVAYAKRVNVSDVALSDEAQLKTKLEERLGAPDTAVDHITKYVYDENKRLVLTVDALGYGTYRQYDASGNLTTRVRFSNKVPALSQSIYEDRVTYSVDLEALAAVANAEKDQLERFFYDGLGRETGRIDAEGGYTKTWYNPANPREVKTTRFATPVTYPLLPTSTGSKDVVTTTWTDGLGRTIRTQDGEGYVVTYGYDALGRMIKRTDEGMATERRIYDAAGNLTHIADALGNVTVNEYDKAGRLIKTSLSDGLGSLALDSGLNLAYSSTMSQALGSLQQNDVVSVTLRYRAEDGAVAKVSLSTAEGAAGTVMQQAELAGSRNTGDGWITRTVNLTVTTTGSAWLNLHGDTAASRAQMDSDVLFDKLQVTVKRNGTTIVPTSKNEFNELPANVKGKAELQDYINYNTLADSVIQAYSTYEPVRVTAYEYDAAGRLIEEIQAAGLPEQSSTRYVLDKSGRREKIIDPRGVEAAEGNSDWAKAYRLGRFGYTATPDKIAKASDYQALLGDFTTTQVFDKEGRVIESRDPLGSTTETNYDAFGNAIRIKDPNGNFGYFVFDQLNQATWQIDPMGYATETKFNGLGQVDEITKYDRPVVNLHNVWSAPEATPTLGSTRAPMTDNTSASLPYLEKTASKDATTYIQHDRAGRQTKIIDAEGFFESMTYDALGNKIEYSAKSNTTKPDDLRGVHRYEYDKNGRLIKEYLPPASNSNFTLGISSWVAMTSEPYTTTGPWTLTKHDRDVTIKLPENLPQNATYDVEIEFEKASLTVDGTGELPALSYVGQVVSSGGILSKKVSATLTGVTVAQAGLITAPIPYTIKVYETINGQRGALAAVSHSEVAGIYIEHIPAVNAGTNPLSRAMWGVVTNRYEYDSRGNRIKSTEADGMPDRRVTTYNYDALNRQISQFGESMPYLASTDNATMPIMATGIPTERMEYDAAGNVISRYQANGAVTHVYYDAQSRKIAELTSISTPSERAAKPFGKFALNTFAYDAAGNLVMQRAYADPIEPTEEGRPALPVPDTANYRETRLTYNACSRLTHTALVNVTVGEWNPDTGNYEIRTQDLVTETLHDQNGNPILERDARGNYTRSFFDLAGRRIAQIDASRYFTRWEVDGSGNVTNEKRFALPLAAGLSLDDPELTLDDLAASVAGGAVRETVYEYDLLGRVERKIVKDVEAGVLNAVDKTRVDDLYGANRDAVTEYVYNGLGMLVQRKEATGEVLDWQYDLLGRQVRQQGAAFTAEIGGLASPRTVRQTLDTEYDAMGQKTRVIERSMGYSIVPRSNFLGVLRVEERATSYRYGANGTLLSETDAEGFVTSYQSDLMGNVTMKSIQREGVGGNKFTDITLYRFDDAGRQLSEAVFQVEGANGVLAAGMQAMQTKESRYNAFGEVVANRTFGGNEYGREADDAWFEHASYDNAGRVVASSAESGATKAYLYDAAGNATLTMESSSVDLRSMTLEEMLRREDVFKTVSQFDARNKLIETRQYKRDVGAAGVAINTADASSKVAVNGDTVVTAAPMTKPMNQEIQDLVLPGKFWSKEFYFRVYGSRLISSTNTISIDFSFNIPDTRDLGGGNVNLYVMDGSASGRLAMEIGASGDADGMFLWVSNTNPAKSYPIELRKNINGEWVTLSRFSVDPLDASGSSWAFTYPETPPLVLADQPTASQEMVMSVRRKNSNDPWLSSSTIRANSDGSKNATFVWSGAAVLTALDASYEVSCTTLDSQGNILSQSEGELNATSAGLQILMRPVTFVNGGYVFTSADGVVSARGLANGAPHATLYLKSNESGISLGLPMDELAPGSFTLPKSAIEYNLQSSGKSLFPGEYDCELVAYSSSYANVGKLVGKLVYSEGQFKLHDQFTLTNGTSPAFNLIGETGSTPSGISLPVDTFPPQGSGALVPGVTKTAALSTPNLAGTINFTPVTINGQNYLQSSADTSISIPDLSGYGAFDPDWKRDLALDVIDNGGNSGLLIRRVIPASLTDTGAPIDQYFHIYNSAGRGSLSSYYYTKQGTNFTGTAYLYCYRLVNNVPVYIGKTLEVTPSPDGKTWQQVVTTTPPPDGGANLQGLSTVNVPIVLPLSGAAAVGTFRIKATLSPGLSGGTKSQVGWYQVNGTGGSVELPLTVMRTGAVFTGQADIKVYKVVNGQELEVAGSFRLTPNSAGNGTSWVVTTIQPPPARSSTGNRSRPST